MNKSSTEEDKTKKTRKKSPIIFVASCLTFVLIALVYWIMHHGIESTGDAKIAGHIVSVASRIQGQVIKVFVDDNSLVKSGDPLVILDDALERTKVELAQADFDSAVANFEKATVDVKQARANFLSAQSEKKLEEKNFQRVENLFKQHAVSPQAVDQQKNKYDQTVATLEGARAVLYMSENMYKIFGNNIFSHDKAQFLKASEKIKGLSPTLDAAIARLKNSKANLDIANLNLKYTTVYAPYSGVIANKNVEVGKNVNPETPLMSVVSLSDVWVVANFKETQLRRIRPGDKVDIRIDAYGGQNFFGVVNSVSPASGDSFALLPPDNASGNFVKVTQRFPVKILFTPFPQIPMRPGMSLEARVKVSGS